MNIPDHISESLETIFWVKILNFFDADADPGIFMTLDPGSGMEKFGSGIWYKHPGSATLLTEIRAFEQVNNNSGWTIGVP
jgi:hypothetical protein